MKTTRSGRAAAILLASTLLVGVVSAGDAQAFSLKMPHGMAGKMGAMRAGALGRGRMGGFPGPGLLKRGIGFGTAALATGVALGTLMPRLAPDCGIAEQPAVDDMGNTYYERVRVCE